MDPPQYGRVNLFKPRFCQHLDKILVAQSTTAIPPDREQDDIILVMSPEKRVFSRFSFDFQYKFKGV